MLGKEKGLQIKKMKKKPTFFSQSTQYLEPRQGFK